MNHDQYPVSTSETVKLNLGDMDLKDRRIKLFWRQAESSSLAMLDIHSGDLDIKEVNTVPEIPKMCISI